MGGARGARPPPLFFDENEALRTEKNFLGRPPSSLSQGLDDPPPLPPLSEGLDPPLLLAKLYYLLLLLTKMASFSRGCKSRIILITEWFHKQNLKSKFFTLQKCRRERIRSISSK